ncbi:MAG: APC family permease [Candidatus Kapaibacterium sp.]
MSLPKRITLLQATAINMIDMVGIGPFIVSSTVVSIMGGANCLYAWLAGAVLSLLDSKVWSELGAALPEAGGSYAFLRETYGKDRWGRMISFLFIWQTLFQSSFVVASGAIGFSGYVQYLLPIPDAFMQKLVSGAVVVCVTAALYRNISSIGKLSVVLWVCVIGTLGWIIVSGLFFGHLPALSTFAFTPFRVGPEDVRKLGDAMQLTVYAYLGYYNVCHLGSEIVDPGRNIPRSMLISILGIAVLYILMQVSILSVLDPAEIHAKQFIVSLFMERLYGPDVSAFATVLVLLIALSSLFAVILGYSRIPYAAARQGNFLPMFAATHPTENFPHVSLLFIGGISLVITMVTSDLKLVVGTILTMRILVQFVGQSLGLVRYRKTVGAANMPFRMWLYPVPLVVGVGIWLWLFFSRDVMLIAGGLGMLLLGVCVYLGTASLASWFPFSDEKPSGA